jgi:hypothetical protein
LPGFDLGDTCMWSSRIAVGSKPNLTSITLKRSDTSDDIPAHAPTEAVRHHRIIRQLLTSSSKSEPWYWAIAIGTTCQPHGRPVSIALCCVDHSTPNTITSLASPEQPFTNGMCVSVLQPKCTALVVSWLLREVLFRSTTGHGNACLGSLRCRSY